MPLSKSPRPSKSSRPSLPTMSSFLSMTSPESSPRTERSERRKSALSMMLTSFFTPTSPSPTATSTTASTSDETRQLSQQPELPQIQRKALPSNILVPSSDDSSFGQDSPSQTSVSHDSVSTIGQSPETQASDLEFDFTIAQPDPSQPLDAEAAAMPAVIQKHRKAPPRGAPQHAPSLPLRLTPIDSDAPPPPPPKDTSPTSSLPTAREHQRSSSANSPPEKKGRHAKLQPARRPAQSPGPDPQGRSSSTHVPPSNALSQTEGSRVVSEQVRPVSKQSNDGDGRGRLRRSWLPGGRSRSGSKDLKKSSANAAWILTSDNHAEYNTSFLTSGGKVPELWNEAGSVYVYLDPKGSGRGPSFKIPADAIEASIVFHELIQGEREHQANSRNRARSFDGRDTLSVQDARTDSYDSLEANRGEDRLYILPAAPAHNVADEQGAQPDLVRLIALRNLFAFLTGQPLVATKAHPTIFAVFLEISALLKEFDFCSMDGTTWGDAVDLSFGFYMSQLALADVRHSREKTLEALVLGEHMRCWELYNEAFTHAVGKFAAIVDIKSPLFEQVSPNTRRRLERSHLDLLNRQDNVNMRLEDFEFPALFAGVGSSSQFKDVRFKNWRNSFLKMRGFVLSYYKSLYGNWPVKAKSKKNSFSESGLNRLVLKALYYDLCSLYDLLVDRDSFTPRGIDQNPEDITGEADPTMRALRAMLGEFDHSSPPVLPPIPFDVPKIPTMKTVSAAYDELKEKKQARFDKKIQAHELQLIVHKSYNFDADSVKSQFLNEFREFDIREAKGKSNADLADNRIGTWLFLYVVIQSLPLLVIDAPELRFTEGVEYFLCQPPMGNAPWIEDVGEVRKAWYQLPGSQVKVELSADVVMFSVEGTYQRSHCWEAAKRWEEAKVNGSLATMAPAAPPSFVMSPLEAPRAVFEDMDPSIGAGSLGGNSPASSAPGSPVYGPVGGNQRRIISPGSGLAAGRGSESAYRSSFAGLGLEPLPPPAAVDRRSSRVFSGGATSRADSLGGRPSSAGPGSSMPRMRSTENFKAAIGSQQANPSAPDLTGQQHNRQGSSTFDDILKDMGNQPKKPAKKKFGF